MARTTKTMTVSLSRQVFDQVDRLAKEEHKTKSELFRNMLGVYQDYQDERRWGRLRSLGRESGKRLNIRSEKDIEKLVHESRGIKD